MERDIYKNPIREKWSMDKYNTWSERVLVRGMQMFLSDHRNKEARAVK